MHPRIGGSIPKHMALPSPYVPLVFWAAPWSPHSNIPRNAPDHVSCDVYWEARTCCWFHRTCFFLLFSLSLCDPKASTMVSTCWRLIRGAGRTLEDPAVQRLSTRKWKDQLKGPQFSLCHYFLIFLRVCHICQTEFKHLSTTSYGGWGPSRGSCWTQSPVPTTPAIDKRGLSFTVKITPQQLL